MSYGTKNPVALFQGLLIGSKTLAPEPFACTTYNLDLPCNFYKVAEQCPFKNGDCEGVKGATAKPP